MGYIHTEGESCLEGCICFGMIIRNSIQIVPISARQVIRINTGVTMTTTGRIPVPGTIFQGLAY